MQPKTALAASLTENSLIGTLAVDPGDGVRYCSGTFNSSKGDAYVTMQTNSGSERSIQWGMFIKPSSQKKYKPEAAVAITSAYVNGNLINQPYHRHQEAPSYNFHGSMKKYQVKGKNYSLKANDIVKFRWGITAEGPGHIIGQNDNIQLTCRVK